MPDLLPPGEPAWLVVDHADGTRQHVRLATALTTIGRSDQNVLELVDPKLSRFHCEVERRGGAYFVRDCSSRNGTRVNDEPATASRRLADGDRIQIGLTVLTFRASRPEELRSDRVQALPRAPGPAAAVTPRGPEPPDAAGTTTIADPLMIGSTDATVLSPPDVARPTAPLKAIAAAPAGPPSTSRPTLAFDAANDTPPAQRRPPLPPAQAFDARQTQAIAAHHPPADLWLGVARTTACVLDATSRDEVLECAVQAARTILQPRGVLVALGERPDRVVGSASAGLEPADAERCLDLARRVYTCPDRPVRVGRHVAVAMRSRGIVRGAVVLHDLPGSAGGHGSPEADAIQVVADVVARTLTSSLQLEEVRREERAEGARRIAEDLRDLLRPSPEVLRVPGVDAAVLSAPSGFVGRDAWDVLVAPPRAGRREVFFAVADVPDADAPHPPGLRRRGERGLASLLGQAELRGALRSTIEVLPRASDQVVELNRVARQGGARLALLLVRFDPSQGALRFAGAGHEPLVLFRAATGAVEAFAPTAPALGVQDDVQVAERVIDWVGGDVVVAVTAAATRACPPGGGPPLGADGLVRIVARAGATASAARTAHDVVEGVLTHAGVRELEELTVLVLRRP